MTLQLPKYPISVIAYGAPASTDVLNTPIKEIEANLSYLKDEIEPLATTFYVDENGNVGITPAPSEKLEVDGNVVITNSLIVNGAMTMPRNQGLIISRPSATTIKIDAEFITAFDSNNLGVILGDGTSSSISLTLDEINNSNDSDNGLLGLDTGDWIANTWYHIYIIYDGTAISCVASLASRWIGSTNNGTAEVNDGVLKTNILGYTYGKYVSAVYVESIDPTVFREYQQIDRDVIFLEKHVGNCYHQTSYTDYDISKIVPSTTFMVGGSFWSHKHPDGGPNLYGSISATNSDIGRFHHNLNAAAAGTPRLFIGDTWKLRIIDPTTIYAKVGEMDSMDFHINTYTFREGL